MPERYSSAVDDTSNQIRKPNSDNKVKDKKNGKYTVLIPIVVYVHQIIIKAIFTS